jgi:CAAX protease family protein
LTEPPAGPPAGLFQFALGDRHAPALFVTGWIATILGAGAALIGFLTAPAPASAVLLILGFASTSIGLLLLGGAQTVERMAAKLAYAGPSPVLVFLAMVTTTPLALTVVGLPLELAGIHVSRPVGDLLAIGIESVVFVGLVRLMVVGPGAIHWSDMGFGVGRRRIAEAVASGVLFAAPIVFLTALVGAVLIAVFGVTPPSPLPPTGTTAGLLLNLVSGALFAPVSEEIVFRGFAVTAWARMAGPRAAIVWAAVLFSIAHVLLIGGQDFGQAASLAVVAAVGRLPVALALGWLYVRSRTIWAPIALHAAFNAILIVVSEVGLAGIAV